MMQDRIALTLRAETVPMKRTFALATALALLLSGCSLFSSDKDKPEEPKPVVERVSPEKQDELCRDPNWRQSHLGLWFSVCRGTRL